MLKVKNLTLLSQKNVKKAGILTMVDFNQNFVLYLMKVILGR